MPWSTQRTTGRPGAYKLDRAGTPIESGPFVGIVKNNNDPIRAGRVQVWIEEFSNNNPDDNSTWRTVSYISPFYGTTQQFGTDTGEGSFSGNKQSYGMWFTPPDIGTEVICFFASGDPNQGYYIGSIVKPAINHMLPAIGSSDKFKLDNSQQSGYFSGATRLPVTEINDENQAIDENPKFFDEPKPVHSVVASIMLQQGVIKDPIRGPIGSNAQRESPSTVYGMSTPGRPIFAGGLNESDIKKKLETGAVLPQDAVVIARRGGHSIIMDDGDLSGQDQLIRIRTAKGHQITMSDSGDSFYIIHANGQTWMEFGAQGTVDVYASNSINFRSQGDINFHADRGVNINAKTSISVRGEKSIAFETETLQAIATKSMTLYSDSYVGIKSDGTLSLKAAKTGTFNGGSKMTLSAGVITLNGGSAPDVKTPQKITLQNLPDTKFENNKGWVIKEKQIKTVVTRAPTHEPFPYHGAGVSATTNLESSSGSLPFSSSVNNMFDSIQGTSFSSIGVEQFENQMPATTNIGSILPEQVTGMLAQANFSVPQEFNELSNSLGVGKYGFSAAQLETVGLLKPGTTEFFLSEGTANLTSVLNSPSVWTGLAGVTEVSQLLNDSKLQDLVQTDLYQTALQGLQATGIATGAEDPSKLAGLVQTASKYGAETVGQWLNGTVGNIGTLTDLNTQARSAEYAVQLVTQKVSQDLQGFNTTANAVTNVTSRAGIDQAITSIIGNAKIPTPSFSSGLSLYSSLSNDQLTYNGNDETILANINSERVRRGLSPI